MNAFYVSCVIDSKAALQLAAPFKLLIHGSGQSLLALQQAD